VLIVFGVVGLVLIVVIALVAVGAVVGRLETEPRRNVFEHDEALEFVAQALPDALTAQLSYEEVERILRFHLDYLHSQGVARSGGDLDRADGFKVLGIEGGVDDVLSRASLVDFFPRREAVEAVIGAQLAYFEAIGAVAAVEVPELEETLAISAGDDTRGEPGATGPHDGAGQTVDGAAQQPETEV
jgi:hypothetical protein